MNLPTVRAKCLGAEVSADLPPVWQGRALNFECGFFHTPSQSESNFNNVATFELTLYRDRNEGTELLTTSLAASLMTTDGAIDPAAWDAGSVEHLVFYLTGAQMDVRLIAPDERLWWAVRSVLESGHLITMGGGYITLREDGGPAASGEEIPPLPDGTSVIVTDGIASAVVDGVTYRWAVVSSVGNIASGTGTVQVINGIATLTLPGGSISWVVFGEPGTSGAAEPFILTVANGIGSFTAGGNPYTYSVTQ